MVLHLVLTVDASQMLFNAQIALSELHQHCLVARHSRHQQCVVKKFTWLLEKPRGMHLFVLTTNLSLSHFFCSAQRETLMVAQGANIMRGLKRAASDRITIDGIGGLA